MPPPLSPDEQQRLAQLERASREHERWRKDHEAQHTRERSEIRREVDDMTAATVRHVEKAIADGLRPVSALDKRLSGIEAQNAAQMVVLEQQNGVLGETRAELGAARLERERRAALDEARAKLEKDAKDTRDAESVARGERTKRLAVYATILVALVGALVTLIVAAINSHAGKPSVAPVETAPAGAQRE